LCETLKGRNSSRNDCRVPGVFKGMISEEATMYKSLFAAVALAALILAPTLSRADDTRAASPATGAISGTSVIDPAGPAADTGSPARGTVGTDAPSPRRDDRVIIETQPPSASERRCVEDAETKRCVDVQR
jgi:hypothetical protein